MQQLRDAIPSDHTYRFLLHDRHAPFSSELDTAVAAFGVRALKTPVRTPQAWATAGRMPECQLVHEFERCAAKNRNLATRLQPGTAAQFVGIFVAYRVCTNPSGDAGMRKASTWMLGPGTQTPSPAPDPIPAETKPINGGLILGIGTTNGGTSVQEIDESPYIP